MRAAPSAAKPLKAATPTAVDPCDVCGGPTYERNCKVICHRCGYTRDCSDPWVTPRSLVFDAWRELRHL